MSSEKEVDQEAGRDETSEKEASADSRLSEHTMDLMREQSESRDPLRAAAGAGTGAALGSLEIVDSGRKNEKAQEGERQDEGKGAADAAPKSSDSNDQYKSDVQGFRDRMIKAGIDPDKVSVRVGVRELDASDPRSQEFAESHAQMVACAMKDRELGLSRDLPVKMIKDKSSDLTNLPDDPAKIADVLRSEAREVLDSFNKTLRSEFLDPNNKEPLRVINASNGGTPADFAGMLFERFREEPEKFKNTITEMLGEEKAKQWIEEQNKRLAEQKEEPPSNPSDREGDASADGACVDKRDKSADGNDNQQKPEQLSETSRELLQKLVGLSENAIGGDPQFKESLERYQHTAKEIADKGGVIVIAAGNTGEFEHQYGVKLSAGSQYNFLGMSDHVITVGSSDANGTPGDNSDDKIAQHSSNGTERFAPTVVAQGLDVPTSQTPDGKVGGTSIAAPIVANAIALILTQNPDLSFDQVKRLLQENSRLIPGVPREKQGAGILLVDKAVIAARNSRR